MKKSSVMVGLIAASLVCSGTMHAAKDKRLISKASSVINKLVGDGGLRRLSWVGDRLVALPEKAAVLFANPTDGGYSLAHRTVAAGALALTCWGSTVSLTGCSKCQPSPSGDLDTGCIMNIIFVGAGVMVAVMIAKSAQQYPDISSPGYYQPEGQSPALPNWDGIEQHHLSRNNLIDHSLNIDNKIYRGVLVNYRNGSDILTGLAFSPDAPLAFSFQGGEQGRLAFMAKDHSFQSPEGLTIKHLDGETPDTTISFAQVENVLLKSEDVAQPELQLGNEE